MSLLYKALHQASQLREKGSLKPDSAAHAGGAAALPLAERLMAQGFPSGSNQGGALRFARVALFGLLGVGVLAIGASFLMPPATAPLQLAAPQPQPQPQTALAVAPEAPPPVAPDTMQQAAPAAAPAPEPSIAEAADSLAAALDEESAVLTAAPAPQGRIGGAPVPEAPAPRQKQVRDGGLENFVEAQLARETQAALGPPVTLNNSGSGENFAPNSAPNSAPRAPAEITDETGIVRERYESAALLLERDQPEQALHIYDQLLRNNPGDRLSLLGRAAALQKLGRTLMAISAYEDVLASFPGDEWALVNLLGLVSAQEPQRALTQLERLRRLHPSTAMLPAQIGMLYMEQGNYEQAARNLDRALALDPENAKYVFNLAVVYDKWGQSAAALRYYRQCLELAAERPDGQIPVEIVRSRMAFLDVK